MGHPVTVYAAAALLLAASSGPVLATVRDASLEEFASLKEPSTLDDFPFLKHMEPYLPPIVVDWLIIRPDQDLELPDGVTYRVDGDGRVILIWPDGCEETQEEFRAGSQCEDEPPADCTLRPLHPDCLQEPCPDGDDASNDCPSEDCPSHQERVDGQCLHVPCTKDNASMHEKCEGPPPPPPRCPAGSAETTDDGCIATVTHGIANHTFTDDDADTETRTINLRAHYANLSLEVRHGGLPFPPGWAAYLYHQEEARRICWIPRGDTGPGDCEPGQSPNSNNANVSLVDDQAMDPIPPGKLTFHIEYRPGTVTTGLPYLELRLYGRPTQNDTG